MCSIRLSGFLKPIKITMKKNAKVTFCRGARLDQGFALLLVLVAITLASLLALGMLAMSRLDRSSSRGISNSDRTELLAQAAVEHAVSILDHNIPQPLPPGVDSTPAPANPGTPNSATYVDYLPDHASSVVTPTNWVINPGLLTLISGLSKVQYVPLSSNPTDPYGATASDPNLNAQLATTGRYPIRGDGTPLYAGWVNVLKDPTQPASVTNPIVGRYAFWIDDESAKVNVNMAYGKKNGIDLTYNNPLSAMSPVKDESEQFNLYSVSGNPGGDNNIYSSKVSGGTFAITVPTTDVVSGSVVNTHYSLWHPAAIDLDTPFTGINRDSLATFVHNIYGKDGNGNGIFHWQPLQTIEGIKPYLSSPDSTFEDLKFDITTRARSPEFNVFGKSRLYMESRAPLWDSDMFFQLNYDADGPVYFQSTETIADYWTPNLTGIYSVVNSIEDKLTRTDWPGMPARSFYDKWLVEALAQPTPSSAVGTPDAKADTLREIDQVAWNIAALATYSADREPPHNVNSTQTIQDGSWWPETKSLGMFLLNRSPPGSQVDKITSTPRGINSISQKAFNMWCQRGELSGKAILPWFPRPLINEVAVVIQIRDKDGNDIQTTQALTTARSKGGYFVAMALEYEMYEPNFMPPFLVAAPAPGNINIIPIHFEYSMQDVPFLGLPGLQTCDLFAPTNSSTPSLTVAPNAYSDNLHGIGELKAFVDSGYDGRTVYTGGQRNALSSGKLWRQNRVDNSYFPVPKTVPSFIYATPGGDSLRGDHNDLTFCDATPPVSDPTKNATASDCSYFNGTTLKITKLKLKIAVVAQQDGGANAAAYISQIIPIWDNHEAADIAPAYSTSAFKPPAGQTDVLDFVAINKAAIFISVDDICGSSNGQAIISLEVNDARNGGNSSAWTAASGLNAATPGITTSASGHGNSLFGMNTAENNAGAKGDGITGTDSKYRFFDYGKHYYDSVDNRPSIGMLSILPLGMQRCIPYDTLKWNSSRPSGELPDWLLLDIVAPTIRPYSYMNSAMGKVNLNAQLYDGGSMAAKTAWESNARWRPLQAVFQNMESATTSGTTGPSTVVGNILNHAASATGLSPAEAGDGIHPPTYDYIGELCDISGVASGGNNSGKDTAGEWGTEGLIRNVANLVTTQSNTFTIWGITQSIQKSPANKNYGTYEAGDQIQSVKRFTAGIERYVWPGKDGVPGNGAVDLNGNYINAAQASDNTTIPGVTVNYAPNYAPYGASHAYFNTSPSPPKVGLFPWLPLPVPPVGSLLGGGGTWGPLASGAKWPTLDGPDTPTFPNVPGASHGLLSNPTSRYDYGYRSYNSNTMTFNGNGTPNVGNGFMAADTTGNHNVWGLDDPTGTNADGTKSWTQTALENSNNPVRAWMKYRTIDFRYLDQ